MKASSCMGKAGFMMALALISTLLPVAASDGVFPIRVSANKRYFVDQQNHPFFLQADTPWSLFVALDTTEVRQYLVNRKNQGFNTLTINLIEHWFNGETLAYPQASMNRDGNYPFTAYLGDSITDFTSPNEKYFRHVDEVLHIALRYGFLVMMTPAYLGYDAKGLREGWYDEVIANGKERCRAYGRFLGKRYAQVPNIIWVMNGDRNTDSLSRPLELEIVRGIRDFDKIHLFTAHCHPTFSSRDQWEGADWLSFNSVYTYSFQPFKSYVYAQCLRSYRMKPAMPTILFETCYENEHNAPEKQIRAQMYRGWLCAIAGVQFGNLPLWRFGEGWQAAMNWQGSYDAAIMKRMVNSRNWYMLVPDTAHVSVTDGIGKEDSYVAAARTENGETLITYIPDGTPVQVDLGRISGKTLQAWWFNPRNGLSHRAGLFTTKQKMQFIPPDRNDWLLVIDDASCGFGAPGQ